MDRADALSLLPPQYETALRLAAAGADERLIAAALDVEQATIGPLLAIAEAKLRRVVAEAEAGTDAEVEG